MRVFLPFLPVAALCCAGQLLATSAVYAQTAPALSAEAAAKVVQMLEASGSRYSKLSPTSWLLRFDGAHKTNLPVYVVATDRGISLIAVIASSADVLNHAEVARQLLRLNGESAGNFALDSDDDYVVETFQSMAGVDAASFTSRLKTIVAEADDAYSTIKGHVASGGAISPTGVFSTPAAATASLPLLGGRAAVAYDPRTWTSKATKEPGRFEFQHAAGDGYGIVIAERLEIPTENMRAVAEVNIKDAGGTVESIRESRRTVNGNNVLMLEIEATVNGIRVTYLGYFLGGPAGTIQVFTFTGRNLLPEYRADFESFLNGLTVRH